jgi:cytochrome P450
MILASPVIFPEPDAFRPSRWLSSENEGASVPNAQYQIAFSKGRRQCIGINLAYAELRFAIAIMFRRFELELFGTSDVDALVVTDCFIGMPAKESKGIRVKVVREIQ